MPYKIKTENGKSCVYKCNADGEYVGKALYCYTGEGAEEKAEKYMKALEINSDLSFINSEDELWCVALATSLDKTIETIRKAFYEKFPNNVSRAVYGNSSDTYDYKYVVEVFDSYLIVNDNGQLKRCSFVFKDNQYTFDPADKWVNVQVEYVTAEMSAGREFVYVAVSSELGGKGSGNWGHGGRPGKRGGSRPKGESGSDIKKSASYGEGEGAKGRKAKSGYRQAKSMENADNNYSEMSKDEIKSQASKAANGTPFARVSSKYGTHYSDDKNKGTIVVYEAKEKVKAKGQYGRVSDDVGVQIEFWRDGEGNVYADYWGYSKRLADMNKNDNDTLFAGEFDIKLDKGMTMSDVFDQAYEDFETGLQEVYSSYEEEGYTVLSSFFENGIFIELGNKKSDEIKFIDGVASGEFVDMRGKPVKFERADLQAFVDNTLENIEATKTESGEIVGLPIDENNHDHNGGAGWIIDAALEPNRDVVRLGVNWTVIGKTLIQNNIRRFFSPTIDLAAKVILGGSLTNYPATRSKKGKILLRPVELSSGMFSVDYEESEEENQDGNMRDDSAPNTNLSTPAIQQGNTQQGDEQMPKPNSGEDITANLQAGQNNDILPPVNPEIQALLQSPAAVAELGRLAQVQAKQLVQADLRKAEVVEFASKLVGGTSERPYGLNVNPTDVVTVLLSLDEPHSKAVQKLLVAALEGLISYREKGIGGSGSVNLGLRPSFPAEYRNSLQTWLSAGKPLAQFFVANPEVGNMEDYNLSEFMQEK